MGVIKILQLINVALFWVAVLGLICYTVFIDTSFASGIMSTLATSGALKTTIQFLK